MTSEQVELLVVGDALISNICRDWLDMDARLVAMERVIEAGRKREAAQTRYHALEYDYGTWHPAVMQARDARDLARKEYLDALAALTPARDEIA